MSPYHFSKTFRHWAALLLASFILCGCSERVDLYSRLDEQQSNEVMAALLEHDISCEKTPGEENTWNVTVDKGRFSDAMAILESAGLPGKNYIGIGEIFQKSGMVSSPTEERIRYMYGLSQDLSATLNEIDGVIRARVHVVLPENDPFAKSAKPASASVFIKHHASVDLDGKIPFIKNLVKDSIEGLQYEKISVVLFPSEMSETVADAGIISHEKQSAGGFGNYSTYQVATVGFSAALLLLGLGVLAGRWLGAREKGAVE